MRGILMSSAFGAMVLAAAAAQAAPMTIEQEVKVPFAFTVNGKELPAGTYSVRRDDSQNSALLIQGARESVYILATPVADGSAPQDSSLVFKKDGDRYQLTEIWGEDGEGVRVK